MKDNTSESSITDHELAVRIATEAAGRYVTDALVEDIERDAHLLQIAREDEPFAVSIVIQSALETLRAYIATSGKRSE